MIRHTVNFIVLSKNKGQPDGHLRMRVRWGEGSLVDVNLGYRVEFAKWSSESQRAKANTTHGGKKRIPASTINAEITRYERAAEDAFLQFEVVKSVPDKEAYREALLSFLGKHADEGPLTPLVCTVFSKFVSLESSLRSWSERTVSLFGETRRTLYLFDPELRIGDFTEKKFEELYRWMADERGYASRTIRQKLMSIKEFLRWAKDSGYPVDEKAVGFMPRLKIAPKTVVWLKWDELQTLFAFRNSDELKKRRAFWRDVLDCFLLACFTGLRASDVYNLRWADVGEKHLRVVTRKTAAPLYIELNKYSRTIIGWQRENGSEYVMPRIEKYNTPETLKKICRDAGINESVTIVRYKGGGRREEITHEKFNEISMHSGRRTFICNALSLGINPLTVMKWTGHKDYTSMRPYIDISDADKESAMSKFNK